MKFGPWYVLCLATASTSLNDGRDHELAQPPEGSKEELDPRDVFAGTVGALEMDREDTPEHRDENRGQQELSR